ncbi:hypothetical protein [Bradyrhizobium sp. 930_D9_N1_4]|uniref:hypothetical protein n=1 Tax=Bradyrhizobium sp. 930_D9_N1_4 TaxID=3240374 RepID=UPI003F8CDF53
MRHATGIDDKLELDLPGWTRGGVRWGRFLRRRYRWRRRLIRNRALEGRRFRVELSLPEEAGSDLRSLVVF